MRDVQPAQRMVPPIMTVRPSARPAAAGGIDRTVANRCCRSDTRAGSAGQVNARIRGIFSSPMRSASDQSCKLATLAPIALRMAAPTLSMIQR